MAITFLVSDVAAASERRPALDRAVVIPAMLGGGERTKRQWSYMPPARRIEAWSPGGAAPLVCANDANALAQAAYDAFYRHHPLVLTPDAVWFTLAQGFAHHVALNAEALRGRFVRHQGKEKLVVERPDFFLGQPNPWAELFAAFSDQIAAHVGRLRDLVLADFSTTGPLERAASEVLLMDAFRPYFEYEVAAGCGIPSVTLAGTAEDWKSVRVRAAMLSEFGLERWTAALLPVLDEIVRSAEGKVDAGFWRSFFRYQSRSGPGELTGWIVVLFPYLTDHTGKLTANPYLDHWERALRAAVKRGDEWRFTPDGPDFGEIPSSLASAPVKFVDLRDGSEHPLRFVAGLFGVTQEPSTGALAPEFGWGIVHDVPLPPPVVADPTPPIEIP